MSRIIIFEQHAFKANIWIATLLLTSNNLSSDPVHTCLIVVTLESYFLDRLTQCDSSMIFSHFLRQFVD